jgi:D-alanyl-D-alanine carboxypeptidase
MESKSFSQVTQDRITKPLNLKSLKTATINEPNLALAHDKTTVIHKDYSVPLGAGNIISNSKDMAVFLSALLTGKLIPIKEVHAMMKDLYPMFDKGNYYGKGIMLYDFNEINNTKNRWIGHSGGTENYKAIVVYDLQTKTIMAISINQNIPVEAVAYKLMELISK